MLPMQASLFYAARCKAAVGSCWLCGKCWFSVGVWHRRRSCKGSRVRTLVKFC